MHRKLAAFDMDKLLILDEYVKRTLFRRDFIARYVTNAGRSVGDLPNYGSFQDKYLAGALCLTIDQDKLQHYNKVLQINKKLCRLGHGIVDPSYRNSGLITDLALYALDNAKKESCEYAVCTIHPDNGAGLRVAKKLDFEPICDFSEGRLQQKLFAREL